MSSMFTRRGSCSALSRKDSLGHWMISHSSYQYECSALSAQVPANLPQPLVGHRSPTTVYSINRGHIERETFNGIVCHLRGECGGNQHEKGVISITASSNGFNQCHRLVDYGWNSYWCTNKLIRGSSSTSNRGASLSVGSTGAKLRLNHCWMITQLFK